MYAKFDRLAAELSDDDEPAPGRPRVTRLAAPSSVRIGPQGASIGVAEPPQAPPQWEPRPDPPVGPRRRDGTLEYDYSKWDKWAERQSSDDDAYDYIEDEVAEAAETRARPAAAPAPAAAAAPASASSLPASRAAEFSRNGGAVGDAYLWSQSADEVTISALVPPGTRAKDVSVRLTAVQSAALGEPPRLTVSLASAAAPVLDAPLAHQVDEAGPGADVDWELTDFDAAAAAAADAPAPPRRRAVRVTLHKASPGGGGGNVVHWWRCALAGGPEVDTSAIQDRQRTAPRTAAARAAWADAEAEFKRRVATREPIEVDDASGSDEADAHAEAGDAAGAAAAAAP